MNRFILIVVIFCCFLDVKSQTAAECGIFKTGYFNNVRDGVVNTHMRRTKKYQIEEAGDIKIKLEIKWTSECSYELKFVKGNKAFKKSQGENATAPTLQVRILEVKGNECTIEAKFDFETSYNYKSEIVKVG